MKWHRIYAIILRFLYFFRHSLDRIMDNFYWPTLDLFLWGLTSTYLSSFFSDSSAVVVTIVSGILFWILVYRGQHEVSVNLLEDMWNKNLVNLFVSPLKFSEWIASFIILGIIKAALSFSFAIVLAYLLYRVNIFAYGVHLVLFLPLLIMTGWWVGFMVAGVILRFGTRVQSFAWTLVWVISPFAALYYPVSALPEWAQIVSRGIPVSYIFEGAREVLATGRVNAIYLLIALGLNLLYLGLAIVFLRSSFNAVLKRGLVRLH